MAQLVGVGRRGQRPVRALARTATTSQVTLKRNTKYWGATKPAFDTVVVRNMVAATQLINVGRGSHEVAIDLASDQAQTLQVELEGEGLAAAVDVGVLAVREQRPERLGGDVEQAVAERGPLRARLQVDPVGRRAGRVPDAGDHPVDVRGCAAREGSGQAERREGEGRARRRRARRARRVTLEYPSDLTINGVPFATLAQKVQSNLQAIGINVHAVGLADRHVADELPQRQDGVRPVAVGPGLPGSRRLPDVRPGRPRRPARGLGEGRQRRRSRRRPPRLPSTTDPTKRTALFQQFQRQLNASGPYFPLMQPTQVFVSTSDLKNAVYNAVYSVDVTKVAPK